MDGIYHAEMWPLNSDALKAVAAAQFRGKPKTVNYIFGLHHCIAYCGVVLLLPNRYWARAKVNYIVAYYHYAGSGTLNVY